MACVIYHSRATCGDARTAAASRTTAGAFSGRKNPLPNGGLTAMILMVGRLVRSRGLEPPRVAPLAPQASASTNSATTAGDERGAARPRAGAIAADVTNHL